MQRERLPGPDEFRCRRGCQDAVRPTGQLQLGYGRRPGNTGHRVVPVPVGRGHGGIVKQVRTQFLPSLIYVLGDENGCWRVGDRELNEARGFAHCPALVLVVGPQLGPVDLGDEAEAVRGGPADRGLAAAGDHHGGPAGCRASWHDARRGVPPPPRPRTSTDSPWTSKISTRRSSSASSPRAAMSMPKWVYSCSRWPTPNAAETLPPHMRPSTPTS